MKIIYTVILALLVIFIITFSLENTLPVRLRYLWPVGCWSVCS